MMKLIEFTREYQDIVESYVDTGMSRKEAELQAYKDMRFALSGTR